MAAYTVLNYVYSLCVFYYSVLACVADVADCPLQRLSAIVIKNITIVITICAYNIERDKYKRRRKMWVKPWILCRKVQGAYHTLFNELLNMLL